MMKQFRTLASWLFLFYLAVLPGSIVVVALDRVPQWGSWMGGALLLWQGATVLCWLLGYHGRRGGLAALVVFLLAWGVEHLGVSTGFPFGRYVYTGMLQPQLFGVVPLAIGCAWLMVAFGGWQIARLLLPRARPTDPLLALVSATLVLLLDLQIETISTYVNNFWVWLDSGPYYGVPTANFAAWWLVGLLMALVVARVLPQDMLALDAQEPFDITTEAQRAQRNKPAIGGLEPLRRRFLTVESWADSQAGRRFAFRATTPQIPAWLYLLSTALFTVVNLARGYRLAGLIGAAVLVAAAGLLGRRSRAPAREPAAISHPGHEPHRTGD